MDTQKVTRKVESGEQAMPEVIEDGGYRFRVLSKSIPGHYRVCDLSAGVCTCPANQIANRECRHLKIASAYLRKQTMPEYRIVRYHDSRPYGGGFRLLALSGSEESVVAESTDYMTLFAYREELYMGVAA